MIFPPILIWPHNCGRLHRNLLQWHHCRTSERGYDANLKEHCKIKLFVPHQFKLNLDLKHCQRHNGPEGWVLLCHIASFHTNLDQIAPSESQPSINFKISTKLKHFEKNLNFKILTKIKLHSSQPPTSINSKILIKLQFQNLAWTSTSKSWQNLVLISLNKNLTLWPHFSFQILTKLSSTRFLDQHQQK